jgi:hypothetical protein
VIGKDEEKVCAKSGKPFHTSEKSALFFEISFHNALKSAKRGKINFLHILFNCGKFQKREKSIRLFYFPQPKNASFASF